MILPSTLPGKVGLRKKKRRRRGPAMAMSRTQWVQTWGGSYRWSWKWTWWWWSQRWRQSTGKRKQWVVMWGSYRWFWTWWWWPLRWRHSENSPERMILSSQVKSWIWTWWCMIIEDGDNFAQARDLYRRLSVATNLSAASSNTRWTSSSLPGP